MEYVYATRFTLTRDFGFGDKLCVFVMLNPSTADETHNDPTINRCVGFAKSWGYDSLLVVNTNPMRSTNPKACPLPALDVLLTNDEHIRTAARAASKIVCAWGVNVDPVLESRTIAVLRPWSVWPGLICHLGLTKHGHPRHPLYLPGHLTPAPWSIGP